MSRTVTDDDRSCIISDLINGAASIDLNAIRATLDQIDVLYAFVSGAWYTGHAFTTLAEYLLLKKLLGALLRRRFRRQVDHGRNGRWC